jgi:hypothetical protein
MENIVGGLFGSMLLQRIAPSLRLNNRQLLIGIHSPLGDYWAKSACLPAIMPSGNGFPADSAVTAVS